MMKKLQLLLMLVAGMGTINTACKENIVILNETAYLTKDKCNFAYDKISTTANDVSTAIKMFVHTGKEIK